MRLELSLLLTLGPALIATRGQAATEVEANYRRALALCEQGEPTQQMFSAQLGLWAFYQLRSQYNVALPLGKRLLGMAMRSQSPTSSPKGIAYRDPPCSGWARSAWPAITWSKC